MIIADYNAEYLRDEYGEPFADPMRIDEAAALVSKLEDPGEPFRIAIIGTPDEIIEAARVAWAVGRCLLVIEEIDMYCRGAILPEDINGLVQVGRHRGVSLVGCSRNPAAIPKQFLSQSNCRISFRQTEPRHLQALREYGFDEAHIKTLSKGRFLMVGESNILRRASNELDT